MRCAPIGVVCLALAFSLGSSFSTAQAPQPTPPTKPVQPPTASRGRQAPAPASKLTLTVMVTALDGKTLPGVTVKADGPADREGETDPSGLVTFLNMPSGTYRLRLEHPAFITLEKEVSLLAGKPLRASASLSAAPPPPPPPKPEPPPSPAASAPPNGNYQPSSVPIIDFLEKNFIGSAPVKRSPLGCTASSTSTLLQLREPLGEHVHGDADEVIYVLAGEALYKVGGRENPIASNTFVVIPRGTPHSLVRRGRNPVTVISILTGPPCQPGQQ